MPLFIRLSLFDFFFCVVVLAECFLNGRSMRTGQKRSVNMITPTEILTKRTCELFQDWSCSKSSKSYERQRMCHNNSIHRQNIWCFFEKIKKMLILSLLRKHDDASILRNKKASARRMVSQTVAPSGMT